MVEVGAAKPDYLSVSASFRLSWLARASIEANPLLRVVPAARPSSIIECACGPSDKDDASFFVVHSTAAVYHGERVTDESFSSLGVRGKYAEVMKTVPSTVDEIKVKVRRLDTILRDNAHWRYRT